MRSVQHRVMCITPFKDRGALSGMVILDKFKEVKCIPHGWLSVDLHLSLLLAFFWFIIIPINPKIGMFGLPVYIICVFVNDYNNCANLLMGQSTNSSNGHWCNLVIINASVFFFILVWRFIDGSNILTIKSPIITLINQLLPMHVIVVGHIYKLIVNLVM